MSVESLIIDHFPAESDSNGTLDEVISGRLRHDVLDSIVLIVDASGGVRLVNRFAQGLFGIDEEQVSGRHWADVFIPKQYRRRARLAFSGNGYKGTKNLPILCDEGADRMVSWTAVPIVNEGGDTVGAILTGNDVEAPAPIPIDSRPGRATYETLFDAVPDPVFVYAEDGTILDVNEAGCRFQGDEKHDLVGSNIWSRLTLEVRDGANGRVSRLLGGVVNFLDWPALLTKGKSIPVEVRARKIIYGEDAATLLQVRDLTSRMEALRQLVDLERRACSILDVPTDAILVTDRSGRILWVNRAAETTFGYSFAQLLECHISCVIPCHRARSEEGQTDCLFGTDSAMLGPLPINAQARTRSGDMFPVEGVVKEMEFDGMRRFVAFVRDVSDQRRLEYEVLHATEMERQHVGQEIHDLLASKFSAIALTTRGLINQSGGQSPISGTLEHIVELARSGARSARALSRGLNPVSLEETGLIPALEDLEHQVPAMSGLHCELTLPDRLTCVGPTEAAQLYRIAHEAVNNAIKHAQATKIAIHLSCDDEGLTIRISDDGVGFSASGRHDGMGLHILKYRAKLVGGNVNVHSELGAGTTVTCRIPANRSDGCEKQSGCN